MTWADEGASEGAAAVARWWLAEMEACVRTVDYTRCRGLFAPDVVGYGTRVAAAVGIDALERDQWRRIWKAVRGFTFLTDRLHCGIAADEVVWLACPWTSEGRGPAGSWVARPGRITAVLERRGDRWVAVHTHHSVVPAIA